MTFVTEYAACMHASLKSTVFTFLAESIVSVALTSRILVGCIIDELTVDIIVDLIIDWPQ